MFSSKVHIAPSATVTINALAQQKRMAGQRVYNLSAGEPILNTAQYFEETVDWAMNNNQTFYPPTAGIQELRELAAGWMNDLYKTTYSFKNTLVTSGGKFGVYLLLQALLNEGDEVIMVAPYWVSYPTITLLFGGKPITIYTQEKDGWKVTPQQIADLCTDKTRMVILNNATNPTGALYSKKELEEIVKLCKEKNIFLLSDEVYSCITYDDNEYVSCGSFQDSHDHVIVLQSCSKNFGMTGWRVGFVFAPEEITKKLITLQGQSITGVSMISQWAAIAAFKNASTITTMIRKELQYRRDVFITTFRKLFNINITSPRSTFYSFIPLAAFGKNYTDDEKFCQQLLEEANIALVPGTAFGTPGYVRASFGEKPQELIDAMEVLAHYLGGLQK